MASVQTVKLLDGYALNSTNSYSFTTPWFNIKNMLAYSFSVRFAGTGTATGTLLSQECNEETLGAPWGQLNGQTGVTNTGLEQPYNNGLDAVTVNGTSTNIYTNGTTILNIAFSGSHWARVVFSGTSTTNGCTVTVLAHGKW